MTDELVYLGVNSNILMEEINKDDSDDENEVSFTRIRTKLNQITESDSDIDNENTHKEASTISSPRCNLDDNSNEKEIIVYKKKSRIRNIANSGSESQSENDDKETTSNYDLTRTKLKKKKLQDKFKKFKNPIKGAFKENVEKSPSHSFSDENISAASENSDGEKSCLNINQKLKKKSSHSLTAICDPDTSDEENNINIKQPKSKPRSIKLTSPKAVRMSAKEAMENMQKIKSESNRMLREKEVSLPYHRPKALNLKDIMSRRRPAVTSDGKSLPIKMNNEQLKEYVLLLQQRQKEMMELCKSDTEEEEENCPEEETCPNQVKIFDNAANISDVNDKSFDDIHVEQIRNVSNIRVLKEQNIEDLSTINNCTSENNEGPVYCNNSDNNIENKMEKDGRHIMETESVPLYAVSLSDNIHKGTEEESQDISLHYNSERSEFLDIKAKNGSTSSLILENIKETSDEIQKENISDEFSDNEFTVEELDKIIENVEIIEDKPQSIFETTRDIKPKLTGGPGMVIDFDDDGSGTQKKLTGVELLKERFTYFAKLKSLDDMEKDREKKFKPGVQHLKLKQELEEQIAEQRSLEWDKRLEVENKSKAVLNTDKEGEEFDGEDIEKIEAKLEENDVFDDDEESSSEEEMEDDVDMREKPRKRNSMIDDEAEVSEDENASDVGGDGAENNDGKNDDVEEESHDSEDEDSSESEQDEEQINTKKGRILKAFEDSDDEDSKASPILNDASQSENRDIGASQDDEIQLGQPQKCYSEDLFTSQECSQKSLNASEKPKDGDTSFENELGTQTFSILNSGCENISVEKDASSEKLEVIYETQLCSDDNFDAIVGMCSGSFSQNLVTPQEPTSQLSQSQDIGNDVVALCTGKFYDNPMISQTELDNDTENNIVDVTNPEIQTNEFVNDVNEIQTDDVTNSKTSNNFVTPKKVNEGETKLLKSILDELDDPEFDTPKPNKYFLNDNKNQGAPNTQNIENTQLRKKFVIESDEEMSEGAEVAGKKKKRKKRKFVERALQISDDEEDSDQEEEIYESDLEEDKNRLVEYDSEENEVEIQAKAPKKKRIGKEFFEQEAELTSEDEWIGSGDEDEADLDRMEREEGDDDTFHQGKLQRELGEIHMREVLDQDKREVRLLQELLFEDGDLGDGHRQRKFRWKNADGEEEMGTNADEYADTQEEEFESEEQWRKQRHEREMFLRTLQEEKEEDTKVTFSRSAIIKESLYMKTTLIDVSNISNNIENPKLQETEMTTAKDVPSPKKPFAILQQNYHNSLLTRGRGALARLAALATPLAGDGDDGPKISSSSNRGNFVFAAINPDETEPKVTKRKATVNPDTPRLLKKMRKQESNNYPKTSLLDHL